MFHIGLFISLFLHALILLALFKGTKHSQKEQPIYVEFKIFNSDFKSSSIKNQAGSETTKTTSKKDYYNKTSHTNLHLNPQFRQRIIDSLSPRGDFEIAGQNKKSPNPTNVQEFMEETSFEKTMDMTPFFRRIWDQVNSTVQYPDVFAKQRIEGSVNVELKVDHRGVFTGEILKMSSDNEMLEAYVTAAILLSLQKPLSEKIWIQDLEAVPLAFRFQFKSRGPYDPQPDDERDLMYKNAMIFKKTAVFEPKLNEYIRKYVPPVIIFPGGIYVDFVRLYTLVVDSGRPSEDQMRRDRLKSMKEEFYSTIKKAKPLGFAFKEKGSLG